MLTGLTVPTSGTVHWDDTDLATADAESVWQHVGLVPQKNGHWPLAARENITLGQPREHADDRVWDAAARVGMTERPGSPRGARHAARPLGVGRA